MNWISLAGAVLLQSRSAPDAVAVEHDGRTLSYGDLIGSAAAAAGLLRAADPSGSPVVLALPKSAGWVIGALAAWFDGRAWTPLPPDLPKERRIEAAARLGCVLSLAETPEDSATAAFLASEDLRAAESGSGTAEPFLPEPDGLAYAIHTSGSTGRPKAVMVPHRGLPSMIFDQIRLFGLGPQDRCLWLLNPAFDASVSDVFCALASGAALVIDGDGRPKGPKELFEAFAACGSPAPTSRPPFCG